MFCLPATFVGAALGLLVMRQSLSINAIMGVVMLIGIVTNNSIVLVDYANQLRQKGLSARDALYQAGPIRLRPILMTCLVTVLAMFPLMIGHGEGAESRGAHGYRGGLRPDPLDPGHPGAGAGDVQHL